MAPSNQPHQKGGYPFNFIHPRFSVSSRGYQDSKGGFHSNNRKCVTGYMNCATHPKVETNLSCGKCGKAICPRCMVQTPVGIRCKECANVKHLPTYDITSTQYLKATGVGLGVAIAAGILWGLIVFLIGQFFPLAGLVGSLLIAVVVSQKIAEIISNSVNRKRGVGLQLLAVFCITVSFAISVLLSSGFSINFYSLIIWGLAISIVITRLR